MENTILDLEQKSLQVDEQAHSIAINDQLSYDSANSFVVAIKKVQKEVKDTFGPIIQKAFQAHKEAKAQENKYLEPLLKAEEMVKSKMSAYLRVQENIRIEQEKKLQAEAEKKRQEALRKAEEARAQGKEDKAEKFEEKAANIISPQLAPTVDRGSAIVKKIWHAEVIDLMALVKAIAEGKAPIALIEANMTVLNSQARSLKDNMNYPGVRAVSEDSIGIKTK